MFLWLAADLSGPLASLRTAALRTGLSNPALTLPMHVSLRISFPVEDALFTRVTDRITEYYCRVEPFAIHPQGIERHGVVVWLKIAENDALSRIHDDLIALLRDEFSIPAHPFDESYLFHASLYLGDDAEKAFEMLKNELYPQEIGVNRLLIGISETGRAGEYRVWREVPLIPRRTPSAPRRAR